MEFKIGQKVLVRTWDSMENRFGLDENGNINVYKVFVPGMKKYCKKIVTIESINKTFSFKDAYYRIIEDNHDYMWFSDMFVQEDAIEFYLARRNL